MTVVAISPHLDDAVFGSGHLLAGHPGAVVVTVMAGKPGAVPLTAWDRAAGFGEGDDVVGRRRCEDEAALRQLRGRPIWLDFLDSQYGRTPPCQEVTDALEAAIGASACSLVVSPLGLFHSDHLLTAASALEVARRLPGLPWLLYEDAIYRRVEGLVREALARVRRAGFGVSQASLDPADDCERKRAAIACYRSQLKALTSDNYPGWQDVLHPECYWWLLRQA